MAILKRRRPGGNWCLIFRDASGEQIWRSMKTADKTLAHQRAGKFLEEVLAIRRDEPHPTCAWEIAVERYLKERAESDDPDFRVNPATVLKDEYALRILSQTRNLKTVSDLTVDVLREVQKKWREEKRYGLAGRNRCIRAIKAAARVFEEWYKLPAQRWDKVGLEPGEKPRELWYTPQELQQLIDSTTNGWQTCVMLGWLAGLRPGEILNLPWSRVDFRIRQLYIANYKDWHLKNSWSERHIPIFPPLEKFLLELRRARPKDEYVVHLDDDYRRTDHAASHGFRDVVRYAGLKGSLYTLRHTFGAHLATGDPENGIPQTDIRVIGKMMGHKPGSKATEVYAHLADAVLRAAILRLPSLPKGMPSVASM